MNHFPLAFLYLSSISPATSSLLFSLLYRNLIVPMFRGTVNLSCNCSYEILYEQHIHYEFTFHFTKGQTAMGDLE